MKVYVLIEFKEIEGYEFIGVFKKFEHAVSKKDELVKKDPFSKYVIEYAEILD